MIYVVLLAAAVFRPSPAGAVFVSCATVHALASPLFHDQGYYLSAAFVDLTVIGFLASLDTLDRKILQLQILSAVSMVCNFGGWALWLAYMPPTYYDAAFVALYLTAIAVIIQNGPRDASLHSRLHRFSGAGRMARRKHGTTL
ncbi:MAG: hypothetical protein KAJ19_09830 [Gammaproteobacteria bacterium]|nr:hypothetical protein [Gammaproteobacteria bacterium]